MNLKTLALITINYSVVGLLVIIFFLIDVLSAVLNHFIRKISGYMNSHFVFTGPKLPSYTYQNSLSGNTTVDDKNNKKLKENFVIKKTQDGSELDSVSNTIKIPEIPLTNKIQIKEVIFDSIEKDDYSTSCQMKDLSPSTASKSSQTDCLTTSPKISIPGCLYQHSGFIQNINGSKYIISAVNDYPIIVNICVKLSEKNLLSSYFFETCGNCTVLVYETGGYSFKPLEFVSDGTIVKFNAILLPNGFVYQAILIYMGNLENLTSVIQIPYPNSSIVGYSSSTMVEIFRIENQCILFSWNNILLSFDLNTFLMRNSMFGISEANLRAYILSIRLKCLADVTVFITIPNNQIQAKCIDLQPIGNIPGRTTAPLHEKDCIYVCDSKGIFSKTFSFLIHTDVDFNILVDKNNIIINAIISSNYIEVEAKISRYVNGQLVPQIKSHAFAKGIVFEDRSKALHKPERSILLLYSIELDWVKFINNVSLIEKNIATDCHSDLNLPDATDCHSDLNLPEDVMQCHENISPQRCSNVLEMSEINESSLLNHDNTLHELTTNVGKNEILDMNLKTTGTGTNVICDPSSSEIIEDIIHATCHELEDKKKELKVTLSNSQSLAINDDYNSQNNLVYNDIVSPKLKVENVLDKVPTVKSINKTDCDSVNFPVLNETTIPSSQLSSTASTIATHVFSSENINTSAALSFPIPSPTEAKHNHKLQENDINENLTEVLSDKLDEDGDVVPISTRKWNDAKNYKKATIKKLEKTVLMITGGYQIARENCFLFGIPLFKTSLIDILSSDLEIEVERIGGKKKTKKIKQCWIGAPTQTQEEAYDSILKWCQEKDIQDEICAQLLKLTKHIPDSLTPVSLNENVDIIEL